jgi:hypothetical protein
VSAGNKLILFGLAIAVMIVAAIITSIGDDEEVPPTTASPEPALEGPVHPQPRTKSTPRPEPTPDPPLRVVVKGGEPVDGVQDLEVDKGDRVRFDVVSDVEEAVHVHGYDLEKPAAPGSPARFNFEASFDGILEVELENAGTEILSLRVNP